MKLETQVCSLELSKQLKELGIKQKSLFYHETSYEKENIRCKREVENNFHFYSDDYYSAFTVAELGEILQGEKLYIFGIPENLMVYVDGKNNEANARAKMLIHILENKLMELPCQK